MTTFDGLRALLTTLGLNEAEALLDSHLERAAKEERSYADFLADLMECEATVRKERGLQMRIRRARLPMVRRLSDFDLAFQPTIDRRQIRELQTLRFLHDQSNVIFLGPPGVGKTHLSIALVMEALEAGYSAYFVTAHDLVADLGRAAQQNRMDARMRVYLSPKLLVIDEMGYLPLDAVGATLFFQLISARYERGSVILTSNKSYGEWDSVLGDAVIATAVLDRLLHHSTTINIRGESYRLKERRKAGLLTPSQAEKAS